MNRVSPGVRAGAAIETCRQLGEHQPYNGWCRWLHMLGFCLACTTHDGGRIEPRNLVRSFVALCYRAGLRRVRFHDLRHSRATLRYVQGVEPGTIQVILGHSSITVTMGVYVEIMRQVQQDAMDRMGELFKG